jgi:hypothetical protein
MYLSIYPPLPPPACFQYVTGRRERLFIYLKKKDKVIGIRELGSRINLSARERAFFYPYLHFLFIFILNKDNKDTLNIS